jgi:mono/diheme cytochrome c family protein
MLKWFSIALLAIVLLISALSVFAFPQDSGEKQKPAKTATTKSTSADPGEKAFKENCGRCHKPPDSLSPRETKAVLQHMRVRAMLTQKDEQLILKFLAP